MPAESPPTATPKNGSVELIRFVGNWSNDNRTRVKEAISAVESARVFGHASQLATPWTVVANAARHYGRRCIAYRHHWSRTFHASNPQDLARRIEAAIEDTR